MTPKQEYLPLFREIVLDVWKSKQVAVVTLRADLRRRVTEMTAKKDRVFDHFDAGKIDTETFRRQTDRADADLAEAEIELADSMSEECDAENVVDGPERDFELP